MSYSAQMQIASALRRKRHEIAATIAGYEARIYPAKRGLTALDQAARLFDPQVGRDETAIPWNRDRLTDLKDNPEPLREANEQQRALAAGPLNPLVARTHGPEHQLTGRARTLGQGGTGYPKNFFIWIGRNPLKTLNSKK